MLHMSQDMWSLSAKLSSRPSRWLQWSIRCDCQRPHRPQRWDKPVPKYNHQKILTIWVHELNQYLQYTEICRTCSGGQEHGTSTDCFKYFLTLFAQGQHVLSSTVSLPHSDTTLVVFTGVQAAFANLHREPIHSQIPSQQFVCVKRCSSVHDIYLRDHVKTWAILSHCCPFYFFHCICSLTCNHLFDCYSDSSELHSWTVETIGCASASKSHVHPLQFWTWSKIM